MADIARNLVEGIGVARHEDLPEHPLFFTQISIPEIVVIPEQKPDIEQLISIMVDVEIVSMRLIDTPKGKSNEGQQLSGKKLSIEILLKQKIKYVADEPTQSVHAAHFDKKMASIFIIVPPFLHCHHGVWSVEGALAEGETTITPLDSPDHGRVCRIEDLLVEGKITVTPYIEDIYGELRDKRTIFKNITLFLDATIRF